MSTDNPILNSPYNEPKLHYATDLEGALNYNDIIDGRRIFSSDIQVMPNKQGPQSSIFDINDMAKDSTKKKVEKTLKIEIDDEAFDRLYGHISHPFDINKDQKIAVRLISQFGEECTKVLSIN
jgi:hypothetical protein